MLWCFNKREGKWWFLSRVYDVYVNIYIYIYCTIHQSYGKLPMLSGGRCFHQVRFLSNPSDWVIKFIGPRARFGRSDCFHHLTGALTETRPGPPTKTGKKKLRIFAKALGEHQRNKQKSEMIPNKDKAIKHDTKKR